MIITVESFSQYLIIDQGWNTTSHRRREDSEQARRVNDLPCRDGRVLHERLRRCSNTG